MLSPVVFGATAFPSFSVILNVTVGFFPGDVRDGENVDVEPLSCFRIAGNDVRALIEASYSASPCGIWQVAHWVSSV